MCYRDGTQLTEILNWHIKSRNFKEMIRVRFQVMWMSLQIVKIKLLNRRFFCINPFFSNLGSVHTNGNLMELSHWLKQKSNEISLSLSFSVIKALLVII